MSFEKNLLLKEIAEVYSKSFDGDLANSFLKVKQWYVTSEDGSLGLDGSGRSLSLALKTKKCMYFG